jgi:benzoyl-CoA reductase/2-hydroxyglutaryl-CoA dehydratase subunit BcrC/BadD/HgdB
MQVIDIEALVKAIDAKGFVPYLQKDCHTISMAKQAIMFKRELNWPEDVNLKAIYRRLYA